MPKSSSCHQSRTPLRPWESFVRIGTLAVTTLKKVCSGVTNPSDNSDILKTARNLCHGKGWKY